MKRYFYGVKELCHNHIDSSSYFGARTLRKNLRHKVREYRPCKQHSERHGAAVHEKSLKPFFAKIVNAKANGNNKGYYCKFVLCKRAKHRYYSYGYEILYGRLILFKQP